jgi:hypothetical protein
MKPLADLPETLGRRPKWDGRATHGSWKGPACVVERLTMHGWGISEATRKVIAEEGIPDGYAHRAFAGIRGAFYQRRKKALNPATKKSKP